MSAFKVLITSAFYSNAGGGVSNIVVEFEDLDSAHAAVRQAKLNKRGNLHTEAVILNPKGSK